MRILAICAFILTRLKLQIETNGSDNEDPSDSLLYLKTRVISYEEPRILGGLEVTPHAHPFQALLFIVRHREWSLCGGTLLDRRWVLTAAHCVGGSKYIDVFLGLHDIRNAENSTTQMFRSTIYKQHFAYDAHTMLNDIAMVRLPQTATLNDYVSVVAVPSGTENYAGDLATVLGWGRTGHDSISKTLQGVTVEVLTNEACRQYHYALKNMITEGHVCTSRAGSKGGCVGDSGGPLLVNGTQIGVVSFGPKECTTVNVPTVFTRLSQFKDWIREVQNSGADTLEIRNALFGLVFMIFALEKRF